MAQQPQILKLRSLNLDASEKYLKETESPFLLNYDTRNPSSIGKAVPFAANVPLCDMEMPLGDNYSAGEYYSPITGESYSWTYNSNGINFIQRVNPQGICEIVYHNDGENNYLKLSPAPERKIIQNRAYLYVEKSNCANRDGKYLIWTDGKNIIGCIDTEASIATGNFTTPFFDGYDGIDFIQLPVPQPLQCISADYIPLPVDETDITNNLLNKGFKFIYRWIYYDKRASEWSDPSTLYYEDIQSCFYNSTNASRCLLLKIPAGNPMVEKVEVGFSKGDIDSNGEGIWYLSDTIEKYKKYNSSQQKWYERNLSDELIFSDGYIEYQFCNNKQCQAIDPTQVSRVYNPTPLEAQALILIKGGLGFVNYVQGNCPIDKAEIEKFHITTVCNTTTDCVPEMVAIKVRAIIHSLATNVNQFIWRNKGVVGDEDDVTDIAWFGGLQDITIVGSPNITVVNGEHDQKFVGRTRNFIVYVEGTEYFAEMKQCLSNDDFNSPNVVGVLAGEGTDGFVDSIASIRSDADFYYQEATLMLPKGMSGNLRICSHKATGLEPDTSTKVAGVINDINSYVPDAALTGFTRYQFEIPFSCNQGEILKTFIIDDATLADNNGDKSSVETVGYIKDNIGTPLEGLEIWAAKEHPSISSAKLAQTDYNGFFYLYNQHGKLLNSTAQIRGEIDGSSWGKIQSIVLNRTNYRNTTESDAVISSADYLNKRFTIIKVSVKDCNSSPVEGIKVSFSGSKAQTTLSDGTAYIKARNYSSRNRVITATVMSKYGCFLADCNGVCNPCSPFGTSTTPAAYTGDTIYINPMTINIASALKHSVGLKAGGNYPFGLVVQWAYGKISAVQELPAIQIDKTQKKGKFSFCSFTFDATGMTLPEDADSLKIVRGANLNDYVIQWVVDKVEKTADRKLKITIQSLNDYNARYFFKTNTNYQYVNGDRVEFIRNGDGSIFDTATYGILNYQVLSPFLDQQSTGDTTSPADYFNQLLIEDDGKLDKLQEGALIELQRSKECVTEPVYYSICASIPIVNGKLVSEKGNFQTFDTFFVQRQIGGFSVQTFEHKTPSDLWGGESVDDTGKAFFVNKYENEKRYGRNISIGSPTQLNYFGDLVKTFDAPEQGDITAANIVDGRIILAIGENDSFLSQASNDLLRVGSDGLIRAATADQVISDAEPKLRGQFGCQYEDIGSVFFGDGFATWIDSDRNAHVVHNYSEAVDISQGRMQKYFRAKIGKKNIINSIADYTDKLRWCIGQNKVSNSLHLTLKALSDSPIFNSEDIFSQNNTTVIFDGATGEYLTFSSFIPEGYSSLNLMDSAGSAFIVYYKGIPYLHPIEATEYNNFFGQAVDMMAEAVFNLSAKSDKNFLAIEVQDKSMWFAKRVLTNKEDFISEIPPIVWTQMGERWSAFFMGNANSIDGIFGDSMPCGYFARVLLVRDNTDNLKYNTTDDTKRKQYSELDLISAKMSVNESAGFEANV